MTIQSEYKGRGLSENVWIQPALFTAMLVLFIAMSWRFVW
jgi:hypothetical protein